MSAITCVKIVDDYFTRQIKQGLTVPEIIETLNQPVLPSELKTTEYDNAQIRRCAQIVSTRHIVEYNRQLTAEMAPL
jgi:hypothetical protein